MQKLVWQPGVVEVRDDHRLAVFSLRSKESNKKGV
jgi:hypothetical protein